MGPGARASDPYVRWGSNPSTASHDGSDNGEHWRAPRYQLVLIARKDGKPHGRPMTAGKLVPEMKQLRKDGLSKREIAKRLGISRTSVIRWLGSPKCS